MFKSLIVLAILLVLFPALEAGNCLRMNFLPMPNTINCGKDNLALDDPCKIFYHVKAEEKYSEHIG
jgi:hypothetical protein